MPFQEDLQFHARQTEKDQKDQLDTRRNDSAIQSPTCSERSPSSSSPRSSQDSSTVNATADNDHNGPTLPMSTADCARLEDAAEMYKLQVLRHVATRLGIPTEDVKEDTIVNQFQALRDKVRDQEEELASRPDHSLEDIGDLAESDASLPPVPVKLATRVALYQVRPSHEQAPQSPEEKDRQIAELKAANLRNRQKAAALEHENHVTANELDALCQELEEKDKAISQMENTITGMVDEITELKAERDEARKDVDTALDRADECESDFEDECKDHEYTFERFRNAMSAIDERRNKELQTDRKYVAEEASCLRAYSRTLEAKVKRLHIRDVETQTFSSDTQPGCNKKKEPPKEHPRPALDDTQAKVDMTAMDRVNNVDEVRGSVSSRRTLISSPALRVANPDPPSPLTVPVLAVDTALNTNTITAPGAALEESTLSELPAQTPLQSRTTSSHQASRIYNAQDIYYAANFTGPNYHIGSSSQAGSSSRPLESSEIGSSLRVHWAGANYSIGESSKTGASTRSASHFNPRPTNGPTSLDVNMDGTNRSLETGTSTLSSNDIPVSTSSSCRQLPHTNTPTLNRKTSYLRSITRKVSGKLSETWGTKDFQTGAIFSKSMSAVAKGKQPVRGPSPSYLTAYGSSNNMQHSSHFQTAYEHEDGGDGEDGDGDHALSPTIQRHRPQLRHPERRKSGSMLDFLSASRDKGKGTDGHGNGNADGTLTRERPKSTLGLLPTAPDKDFGAREDMHRRPRQQYSLPTFGFEKRYGNLGERVGGRLDEVSGRTDGSGGPVSEDEGEGKISQTVGEAKSRWSSSSGDDDALMDANGSGYSLSRRWTQRRLFREDGTS